MQKADLIIKNAKIFTGNRSFPHAHAVAIHGNRILFVGSDHEVESFHAPGTKVVDGEGRTLTAGFIDSHVHLLSGATWMGYAELREVITLEDVEIIIKKYAAANLEEEWIIGWRMPHGIISDRTQIDKIIKDRPVYIRSSDAHTAWVNTRALELAGILMPGKEIGPFGTVVRDELGLANGELRERDAMNAVLEIIPPQSNARIRANLNRTSNGFNKAGITSVHNMNGDMKDLMTYAAAEDSGELNLRVYVPYYVKPETKPDDLMEALEMSRVQMDYVRGGAVKFFMDGVWESYTAYNLEPYADDQNVVVEPNFSLDGFTTLAAACDKLGLQIAVHCCGDAAVRQTLDGFEAVQRSNGKRDSRHRIEHIEVCQPEDMPRFTQLGVIASVQLSHAPLNLDDAGIARYRLGEKRWPLWQPIRDLKNAGATLAFGSDWTVVPYDPMNHIYVAMNREKYSPSSTDQRLSLEECILGYTRDAAYVEFMEDQKGQVRAGYLADLVLFSKDLFQVKSEDILTVKPVLTVFDGRIVFEE